MLLRINKRISKSNNKIETTWNIINKLLGKQQFTQYIKRLTTEGTHLTNQHDIVDAFNKYFSTMIDKTNSDSLENMRHETFPTYSYFDQCMGNSIPPLVFKSFSTQVIISIIKSLKTKNSSCYDKIST